jgi:hypothetical protein
MAIEQAEQLQPAERQFHQAILRAFIQFGGPPSPDWVAAAAAEYGLDPEAAVAALVSRDVVQRDTESGVITAAYPFSGVPTPHRVVVAGGRPVYAMCAIDALGIPFMLGVDATITSLDPVSQAPIRVEVRDGMAVWDPPTAAVLTASLEDADGPKAVTCCPEMNFFATAEAAEAYHRRHPELSGRVLTQAEAIEQGIQYFGDLLTAGGCRSPSRPAPEPSQSPIPPAGPARPG